MPSVVAPTKFLDLVVRSELVGEAELARLTEKLGLDQCANAKEAARALVRAGILTQFQSERLLHGRYRGFFIGGYKVLNLLGSGGMGSIFLAWDRHSGEKVALKVLNDAAKNDAGMLARFELEAEAGARVKHPDVVRTLKVDQTGHVAYVVMEFVEGINLHELNVLHGNRPWPQACDFILQAARGLHHAHQNGIVHRDVKPSNLLVSTDGRVRILDFGLALLDGHQSEDEFSLSMIFGQDCLGTCDYMPPEQARNSHQVDALADVYSLGCTFYYALTSAPPYIGETNAEKLKGHREQRVPNVRDQIPTVPEAVARIIRRMMAKRPENRFGSMAEVVAALSPFAERTPVAFDFERVVRIRANDTRRRVARERMEQRRAGSGGRFWVVGSETGSTSSGLETDGRESSAATSAQRASTILGSQQTTSSPDSDAGEEPSAAESAMALAERFEDVPATYRLIPPVGEPVLLAQKRIVIGRDPGCDVRLSVKGISSRHCELEYRGDGWYVRDLDSKNGIMVNGVPVDERRLVVGDRLTVGRTCLLRFEGLDDGGETAGGVPMWWIVGGVAGAAAVGLGIWMAM